MKTTVDTWLGDHFVGDPYDGMIGQLDGGVALEHHDVAVGPPNGIITYRKKGVLI